MSQGHPQKATQQKEWQSQDYESHKQFFQHLPRRKARIQMKKRVWKLMLIWGKIRRTMHGRGKVIVEDSPCQYVPILSDELIQRLLSMARVTEWHQLQCL